MIGKTWLWWQIWLALKPNLKCTKFAQYKAEYEEKIEREDDGIPYHPEVLDWFKNICAELGIDWNLS